MWVFCFLQVVAGHSDFRTVLRDQSFLQLIRHVSSNYSFLFYGSRLADPDLLDTLDDMIESLVIPALPSIFLYGHLI